MVEEIIFSLSISCTDSANILNLFIWNIQISAILISAPGELNAFRNQDILDDQKCEPRGSGLSLLNILDVEEEGTWVKTSRHISSGFP